MSDCDNLFEYLLVLKDRVQQVIIVQNPQDLDNSITCADSVDNFLWFNRAIGSFSGVDGPRKQLP